MDTLFNNIKFLIMFHMGHIHIMLFIIQHIILLDTRYLQLWTMQLQVSSMSTVDT